MTCSFVGPGACSRSSGAYPAEAVLTRGTRRPARDGIGSHSGAGDQPVEPLRLLFKDEVRAVGLELGVPEAVECLRAADAIAREERTLAGLHRDIWQCPVVLLGDVRSVGVQGDGRTYGHRVVLDLTSKPPGTIEWE